jgi:hypothetical protein
MMSLALASALSDRLKTHALYVLVNDSDSWHYQLYHAGQSLDEFSSRGDEDGEDDEDMEAEAGSTGTVHAVDAQRIILQQAQQWQKMMEEHAPPHLRELQDKWKKTGRITAEEMQQYQQGMRAVMAPLMGNLRARLGEFTQAARSAASAGPRRPADGKLRGHVEHLKPLLQSGVNDEQVLGVLGKQDVFAEETLREFLPLLGIASSFADLSYAYLEENAAETFAGESIRWVERLQFNKSTLPGKGRLRVAP